MRTRLALVTVLAMLLGGATVASVAAASSPEPSTLRPWGERLPTSPTTPEPAITPAGATKIVVTAHEVDVTIVDVGPQGNSPGDQILVTDNLFDRAGNRIGHDQARCVLMARGDVLCDASVVLAGRGQIHKTFLPTSEIRFAFTLFL
jgi:hypothetical protein